MSGNSIHGKGFPRIGVPEDPRPKSQISGEGSTGFSETRRLPKEGGGRRAEGQRFGVIVRGHTSDKGRGG